MAVLWGECYAEESTLVPLARASRSNTAQSSEIIAALPAGVFPARTPSTRAPLSPPLQRRSLFAGLDEGSSAGPAADYLTPVQQPTIRSSLSSKSGVFNTEVRLFTLNT